MKRREGRGMEAGEGTEAGVWGGEAAVEAAPRRQQKWRQAAGREGQAARVSQAELRPTDLGCALREVSSDSFFRRFFSSRGNFS